MQFFVGLTGVGSATLTGGTAQLTTTGLTDGLDQPVYATYDGDDDNEAAVSNIEHLDVLVPTTTTLTADPDRSVFGQPVRFAVTVARIPGGPTGLAPTGTVDITDDTTVIGSAPLTAGRAQITGTPRVGTRGIRATYRASGPTARQPKRTARLHREPSGDHHDPDPDQPPEAGAHHSARSPSDRGHARSPSAPDSRCGSIRPSLRSPPAPVRPPGQSPTPITTTSSTRELGTAVYDARRLKTANGRITITLDQPGKHRITGTYQGNDTFTPSQGAVTVDVTTGGA